jgi:hypothetical protein
MIRSERLRLSAPGNRRDLYKILKALGKSTVSWCRVALLASLFVFLPVGMGGQWREPPLTGSQPEQLRDRTTLAGQAGTRPVDPREDDGQNTGRFISSQRSGFSVPGPCEEDSFAA